MLKFPKLWSYQFKRFFASAKSTKYLLEPLNQRSLIHVSGLEARDFLQGLITNDINHLGQLSGGSMYSLFLNTKGRVLYDTIIYRCEDNNSYYIECDKTALNSLTKHLKMYRVRRKIDINTLENDYLIHTLFDINCFSVNQSTDNQQILEGIVVPCNKLYETLPENSSSSKVYKNLLIFKDPRVTKLGSRIISKVGTDVHKEISEIVSGVEISSLKGNYKLFRYHLGIGEGLNDLPHGNCFPLECNCDYLHGVSFHKGCYIGQELTARTYHTGVVRKRLMPLYFSELPNKLPKENSIIHEGINLGKLRGIERDVGLALLRINQALDFGEISIGNGIAKVIKPSWWPTEVSKERINLQRT